MQERSGGDAADVDRAPGVAALPPGQGSGEGAGDVVVADSGQQHRSRRADTAMDAVAQGADEADLAGGVDGAQQSMSPPPPSPGRLQRPGGVAAVARHEPSR
ncbi:hypothetical protein ACFT8W_00890 [Streptomyces hygroscopicus]|uniref:hypothetical protein n=1 Tax=Streptomyces hygroscopicus TaxID=1912 RepID=UPI003630B182